MNILLIGTGRVAMNLGHALAGSESSLVGIAGRDPDRTSALANALNVGSFSIDDELPEAHVMLLAVSDGAIATVAGRLQPRGAIVVHTSGASTIDLLKPHADRGVLWPVQTFIAERPVKLADTPLVIEGNTDRARTVLLDLAKALGGLPVELDHSKRERLHLAAVFTSNFPVILMIEAQRLLQEEQLPLDLLLPLWSTMAANVQTMGPQNALTGPASRKDLQTIQRHLELLRGDPDLSRIYALLSERILR